MSRQRYLRADFGATWVVTICPTTVLAFMSIVALLFVAQLQSLSAFGFLVFGLTLAIRRPIDLLAEISAYWWIFIIPGWAVLSAIWSGYPLITLRHAVQLAATFIIAVSISSRLSPRQFFLTLFLAYAFAALWSLGFGRVRTDGAGWLGIFGSKNAYSFAMSAFLLISLCLASAPETGRFWRLAGSAGVFLGIFLLIKGQSAGAILTTSVAACAALAFSVLRRFSAKQKLGISAIALFTGLFLGVFFVANFSLLLDLLLATTGKDATLTGRTELWREAVNEWSESPFLGLGYQAVWVEGNPVAEAMWEKFRISSKSGFNFHNTWLSNAVEIGLVGMAAQGILFICGLGRCVLWAASRPRAESVLMAAFMLQMFILSMVEAVFFFEFSIGTITIVSCLVYSSRFKRGAR